MGPENLRDTADIGGDHRDSGSARLDHDVGHGIAAGGNDQEPALGEAVARLDKERIRRIVGHAVRQPRRRRRDPTFLEQEVCQVLIAETLDDLRFGKQHHRPELGARTRKRDLVEIGERHDQAYVVVFDESA